MSFEGHGTIGHCIHLDTGYNTVKSKIHTILENEVGFDNNERKEILELFLVQCIANERRVNFCLKYFLSDHRKYLKNREKC